VCETCTQSTGSSSRRCLLVRATAAAASGHAGAQLSVLGDKAVGAEIDVWWPLDQAWYKGLVSDSRHRRGVFVGTAEAATEHEQQCVLVVTVTAVFTDRHAS
jgi:hypothetical protein